MLQEEPDLLLEKNREESRALMRGRQAGAAQAGANQRGRAETAVLPHKVRVLAQIPGR